jgi:two-component sensor histidine kinase
MLRGCLIKKPLPGLIMAIICLITYTGLSFAQSRERLTYPQKTSPLDTNAVDALLKAAANYYDTEWNYTHKIKIDSALPLLNTALSMSAASGSIRFQHDTYIHLGKYYFRCDNIPLANEYFNKAIVLDSTKGDKKREAEAWYHFADRTPAIKGQTDLIMFRYYKSLALYKTLNDKGKEVDIYQRLARVMISSGHAAEAKKLLTWLLRNQRIIGDTTQYKTYYYLGIIEANNGNYNIAVSYGLTALRSLESVRDPFVESQINSNLGKWYLELEQGDKSLRFYNVALKKFQEIASPDIHEKFYAYSLLRQIAQGMIKDGQAAQALIFVQQQNARMYPETDYAKQFTYGAMADCYAALKKYRMAEYYYHKALNQALYNGRISNSHNEYFRIAQLYTNWGSFDSAKHYIDKFVSIRSDASDINKLKEVQLMLFRIDSAAGKFVGAIKHYQQYKKLNDSIFTEKKSKQVEELQIQYETAQKEQSIQLLKNKEKLQQSELYSANFSKKLFLAGVICLLVILALLYNDYRHKKQKNIILQKQQHIISKKNISLQHLVNEKERLLLEKNVLLDEKEWLLKEIHHRVKNSLQIVISLLYSQSKRLEDEKAIRAFQESQQRIQSIALMHQKLYQSNSMKYVNMQDYIGELVNHLSDAFNTVELGIQFRLNIERVSLSLSQAIPAGLILNEAITNAIKYAFPVPGQCAVNVSLVEEDGYYLLAIADNGKGFPASFDPYKTSSLGLTMIRGLSAQLEADFEIGSMTGVSVVIRFMKERTGNEFTEEGTPLLHDF